MDRFLFAWNSFKKKDINTAKALSNASKNVALFNKDEKK